MSNVDLIGFVGVFILLLAYVLQLFKVIKFNSLSYIGMNLIGASLSCYASVLLQYKPFIILEGVWALVSLIALVRLVGSGSQIVNSKP